MPEVDLLQLILGIDSEIDRQFEFWLSITFAVLIASHVWGDKLSSYVRWLLATLYVFASAVIFLRYLFAVDYFVYATNLYTQHDVASPTFPAGEISILRRALFVAGTIVTGIFVIFPHGQQRADDRNEV